ncbi:hypothetical protein C8R45DRAFT_1107321 [Mycena sanguinolenta]|nr:hypothetical protein C8R45DRAFT_1107321 [Mycena sanguinolenta]
MRISHATAVRWVHRRGDGPPSLAPPPPALRSPRTFSKQARVILGTLIGSNWEQLTSTDSYDTTLFVGGLNPRGRDKAAQAATQVARAQVACRPPARPKSKSKSERRRGNHTGDAEGEGMTHRGFQMQGFAVLAFSTLPPSANPAAARADESYGVAANGNGIGHASPEAYRVAEQ